MDTLEETPAGTDGEPARPPARRSLDRRTVAICVCIALIAALLAGLAASLVLGDDEGSDTTSGTIQLTDQIDAEELFATELLTVAGEPTTLESFRSDQPIVVNLWAQNCVPCIDEMPLLEQAHLDNPDLTFVGVDTQDQLEKAKVMAERTGITYPWVQDPSGEFFYAAKGAGMPTTFVVMPSGEVVASKTGPFASQTELQRWLDDHVA